MDGSARRHLPLSHLKNMGARFEDTGKQERTRGPWNKDKGRTVRITSADNTRTRENGSKLKEGRFRLDVRGKFFTMGVVRCWNSCPERLWMPRPSVGVFKARLDGALGSLGWYYMWRLVALPVAGGWSLTILEVPSNPSHSVIEKPSFCHGADCCPFH